MHWNALQKLIWSILLWSFFDHYSSTAAFSTLFSVVEVCASLQKLSQLRSKDDLETTLQIYTVFNCVHFPLQSRCAIYIFYHILETFQILWPYQQSIKYFALYEEKFNCAKLWNQVPSLDHFVVQNSGDFLSWTYR